MKKNLITLVGYQVIGALWQVAYRYIIASARPHGCIGFDELFSCGSEDLQHHSTRNIGAPELQVQQLNGRLGESTISLFQWSRNWADLISSPHREYTQ